MSGAGHNIWNDILWAVASWEEEQEGKGMIELKPCPFCNAPAKYFRGFGNTWGVQCTFCEVYKGGYDTKEIATERWNRRVNE